MQQYIKILLCENNVKPHKKAGPRINMAQERTVDIGQAQAFLAHRLSIDPSEIALLGKGAWSQCFGFVCGGRDLVIRFGKHVSDFQKDQLAHRYTNADLSIPKVLEIGAALDGCGAISTRGCGVPLESVPVEQWFALVQPSWQRWRRCAWQTCQLPKGSAAGMRVGMLPTVVGAATCWKLPKIDQFNGATVGVNG